MALSLETQEILLAFADENKDNEASWGKYELDELQDAWAELPATEQATSAGKRIQDRMTELASGKDHIKDNQPVIDDPLVDTFVQADLPEPETEPEPVPLPPAKPGAEPARPSRSNTPYIIGVIAAALVLLLVTILFIL